MIEEGFKELFFNNENRFGMGTIVVAEDGKGGKVHLSVDEICLLATPGATARLTDLNSTRVIEAPLNTILKGGGVDYGEDRINFPRRNVIPRCFLDKVDR